MRTREELRNENRLVYTVEEVAKLLLLSRNSVYNGIAMGEIPAIKVGKRILIPRAALEEMMKQARRA